MVARIFPGGRLFPDCRNAYLSAGDRVLSCGTGEGMTFVSQDEQLKVAASDEIYLPRHACVGL